MDPSLLTLSGEQHASCEAAGQQPGRRRERACALGLVPTAACRCRVNIIYEVLRGRIFLFCNVSQPGQPSVITGEITGTTQERHASCCSWPRFHAPQLRSALLEHPSFMFTLLSMLQLRGSWSAVWRIRERVAALLCLLQTCMLPLINAVTVPPNVTTDVAGNANEGGFRGPCAAPHVATGRLLACV